MPLPSCCATELEDESHSSSSLYFGCKVVVSFGPAWFATSVKLIKILSCANAKQIDFLLNIFCNREKANSFISFSLKKNQDIFYVS